MARDTDNTPQGSISDIEARFAAARSAVDAAISPDAENRSKPKIKLHKTEKIIDGNEESVSEEIGHLFSKYSAKISLSVDKADAYRSTVVKKKTDSCNTAENSPIVKIRLESEKSDNPFDRIEEDLDENSEKENEQPDIDTAENNETDNCISDPSEDAENMRNDAEDADALLESSEPDSCAEENETIEANKIDIESETEKEPDVPTDCLDVSSDRERDIDLDNKEEKIVSKGPPLPKNPSFRPKLQSNKKSTAHKRSGTVNASRGKPSIKELKASVSKPKIKLASTRSRASNSAIDSEITKTRVRIPTNRNIHVQSTISQPRDLPTKTIFGTIFALLLVLLVAFAVPSIASTFTPELPETPVQFNSIGCLDVLGKKVAAGMPIPESQRSYVFNPRAVSTKRMSEITTAWNKIEEEDQPSAAESIAVDEEFTVVFGAPGEMEHMTPQDEVEKAIKDAKDKSAREQSALENAIKKEQDRIAEENRKAKEKADRDAAEAAYKFMLEHPQDGKYFNTIMISGEFLPIIVSRHACPENEVGLWRGEGLTDDNQGSYYVGHNPGIFHNLVDQNYTVGDRFVIWDAAGHAKSYMITDAFYVPASTTYDEALRSRTTLSGGECAVLQTCVNNATQYKIMVAH